MKESDKIKLQKLLNKSKGPFFSEIDKIICFYKTVLELERSKEPDITTYYPYAMHFKDNDSDIMLIDLPCNLNFNKTFLDNKEVTFPKDLYIGLPIIRKDKPGQIIAFSLSIDYNDLNGYDPFENLLPIRISNLSLDSRHIDELELTEEIINEIEGEIGKIKSIFDLRALVKRHFGENVDLKMELQLALSSKKIALAQISAELNRLNSHIVEKNDLLHSFLNQSEFNNFIENVSPDELIRVSSLDNSQAYVVAHALSNRFSVVTGAPGTGKTQVILNIIANALMRDKSVLMASKINKAVDNVKERFDNIDPSHYLVRFGNREYVKNQTIPALDQILNRISVLKQGSQNHTDTLSPLLAQYKGIIDAIRDAKQKLWRLEEIRALIPKILSEKSNIELRINEENYKYWLNSEGIKKQYSDVSHLVGFSPDSIDKIGSRLINLRISLQRKYSGLSRIWNNLFYKKKDAETYLYIVDSFPPSIKAELRHLGISPFMVNFKNGDAIIENMNQVISLLERILDWHHVINKENTRHSTCISYLNIELVKINNNYNAFAAELEYLTGKKGELLNTIRWSESTLWNLGPQLVAAKIVEILKSQDAVQKISSYKSYLPDNIPWKTADIPKFIHICKEFLSICRLISVTNLSVKAGFPLTDKLFDILIIDEASQCDVASAIPLILRAKQVVVIGDPMQLRHITSVKVEEENYIREHLGLSSRPYLKYAEQSLWDYAADFLAHAKQNSSTVFLENHYRCHPHIIGYSNFKFYGQFLNILTDKSRMTFPQRGIVMINVHGEQESDNVNINRIEAQRAISIAKEVYSMKADVSIGIVTPFRDQADFIFSHLDDSIKGNVEVNTAYGFQGDEKDVMIYSLVITDNSPKRKVNWIDYGAPNLVNVAVTRARQTLYIVGNADYIKTVSPEYNALGALIRYAQYKNK